jgi:hypothetical protein
MTNSDVETGSAAYIGNRRLRKDQELATATRGRVLLVTHNYKQLRQFQGSTRSTYHCTAAYMHSSMPSATVPL